MRRLDVSVRASVTFRVRVRVRVSVRASVTFKVSQVLHFRIAVPHAHVGSVPHAHVGSV